MGFVTNAGFVEGNAMDGLRKCLTEEFSSIYVFHLRGNARTSGEQRRKEKDNVFGQGTRTPIAISLFVKNPHAAKHGQIFFHDIGDYLSQQEKLDRIKGFTSIQGIKKENGWVDITPDKHHDWLGQRDDSFSAFICLGDKKDKNSTSIFETYSLGVSTNRDTWVYNFSNKDLVNTLQRTISFYNNEVARYSKSCVALSKDKRPNIDKFVDNDNSQISWTVNLKKDVINGKVSSYQKEKLTKGLYRPFTKNWFYFDRQWVERVLQVPRIFPDRTTANFVILINSKYSGHGFVALISNTLPDLHSNGDSQCFPLYLYDTDDDSKKSAGDDLFSAPRLRSGTEYRDPDIRDSEAARSPSGVEAKRRDAITDAGLAHFQKAYPGEKITKEDLFYYIYGLLHSPVYREKYADNLSKELPRIPAVKKAEDFWAFSKSGRALADLHINYEKVKMYPVKIVTSTALTEKHYRVEKMKFKSKDDKSTIIYNEYITVADIPLEAYEYVVNGKSAIEWIVERYCVSTHKDSGIVNDANLWATETEKNPKYILELLQRVITVSLETMKIVKELPGLEV
jgi:predicted helicase